MTVTDKPDFPARYVLTYKGEYIAATTSFKMAKFIADTYEDSLYDQWDAEKGTVTPGWERTSLVNIKTMWVGYSVKGTSNPTPNYTRVRIHPKYVESTKLEHNCGTIVGQSAWKHLDGSSTDQRLILIDGMRQPLYFEGWMFEVIN